MPAQADEPVYSIGAVSRMLEMATSTLRGWEKRYGLVAPGRSKGSHRLYSPNQVEQLRFIKANLEAGVSPADAHRLLARKTPAGRASFRTERKSDDRAEPMATDVLVGGAVIPIHTHYPTFYSTDECRLRIAVPFLREGIRRGQPSFLSASGRTLDAFLEAIAREGIDVEHAIQDGSLVVVQSLAASAEASISLWEASFWKAADAGATVLRVVGDMACEREVMSSDAEMIRYEHAYNGIAKRFPTVTLCQYDVRKFGGEVVYEAMKAHPDVYDFDVRTLLT